MSNIDTLPAAEPATTSADSATNDPRQAGWNDEIHVPECGVYNGNVPVADIERDPGNRVPTPAAVARLARSIEAEGLLQPITLREISGNRYRIIAGETRWLAFISLDRPTIPAMIRPRDEADQAAAGPSQGDVAKRLVENLHRTDLNAVDEARGYKQLCELGRTQKEVGALFGKSQPLIANSIRILSLPDAVLDLVRDGELSGAHAVALARFAKFPRIVARMADLAVEREDSAKQLSEEEVPYAHTLKHLGYVIDIKTRGQTWEHDPVYTVPPELRERDEFIETDSCVFYLREPGTEDLWTPEKKRQDAARAAKVESENKKQEQAVASGKKTAEQVEREKRIASNRKLRAEIEATFEASIDALKAAKEITPDLLTVLINHALSDGRNGNRVKNAETAIGIKIPNTPLRKGADAWKDHIDHIELLETGPLNAVKLAVAAIMKRLHDDDLRFVRDVSPELRLIAQSAPALTTTQRIERAAAKLNMPAAKFANVASMWRKQYPIIDVCLNSGLDKPAAKSVKAMIEDDEALGAACSQAVSAAQALVEKKPTAKKTAAKAKKGGAKK